MRIKQRLQEHQLKDIGPVLRLLGVTTDSLSESRAITGVSYDSRLISAGNAFVCIPGEKVDGNQFVAEAIKNGASIIFSEIEQAHLSVPSVKVSNARLSLALLADHFYDYPSHKLRVIGVTGTNGKTTTTHLLEHIFNESGRKTGLIGTLGARFGGESNYQNTKHTTPQSSDLHKLLASMAASGVSHVAMEVSSHALVQSRVAGCHFVAACLTNVSQDHLDYHQTMDSYWRAKRRLFSELVNSVHQNKYTVVNLDDDLAEQFLSACDPAITRWTYGWTERADVYVNQAEFGFAGMDLSLTTPKGTLELSLKLTGRFNVYNVMAAVAVSLAEGVELRQCKQALEVFNGVPGRFEKVSRQLDGEPLCIVDYAHTPDGLENVLKTARGLVPEGGKLIVVFGCGGDRDSSKRPQMGEIAETWGDSVIITSDNPRSEEPEQIIGDILAGIKRAFRVKVEPDRSAAIRLAISMANDCDVVVVAGKGHENYQILQDRTIPFDDRTEVRLALSEKYGVVAEDGISSTLTIKP